MSTMINMDTVLGQLKDLQRQHKLSTEPMDDYFRGMYNGMECMLCILEHREPIFAPKDKKENSTDGSILNEQSEI